MPLQSQFSWLCFVGFSTRVLPRLEIAPARAHSNSDAIHTPKTLCGPYRGEFAAFLKTRVTLDPTIVSGKTSVWGVSVQYITLKLFQLKIGIFALLSSDSNISGELHEILSSLLFFGWSISLCLIFLFGCPRSQIWSPSHLS